MCKIRLLTQTENHKRRKNVGTDKKCILRKNGFEV